MKRRVLTLSAQALSSRSIQPWTCRRCLAQSAISPRASDDFIASPATPQQSRDLPIPTTFPRTTVSTEPDDAHERLPSSEGGQADARSHRAAENASLETSFSSAELDSAAEADFEARFLASWLPKEQQSQRAELFKYLRRDIRHDVPAQYLTHVDPGALTAKEREQRRHLYRWAMTGHSNNMGEPKTDHAREIKGVVVSAGKMDRTVKVRIPGQRWEPRIKKYYAAHTDHLVHDPNNSLLEGDVVILHRLSVAKTVRHVIGAVTVPYGKPLADRPPVPTPEERLALYKKQRFAKFARQASNPKRSDHKTSAQKQTTKHKTTGQKAAETISEYETRAEQNIEEALHKDSELAKAGLKTESILA